MINMIDLNKKLKVVQTEIEDFQKKCRHEKQQIKFNTKNQTQCVCMRCDKFIRFPTQTEEAIWLKK